jgi:hypothetical protein
MKSARRTERRDVLRSGRTILRETAQTKTNDEKSRPLCSRLPGLHSREGEVRERRPISELSGVAADADPLGVRRGRTVEDPKLMPSRRRDVRVRRGGNCAGVTRARELGEDSAHAHGVTVRRGRRCHSTRCQRNAMFTKGSEATHQQ